MIKLTKTQRGMSAVEVVAALVIVSGFAWKFFPSTTNDTAPFLSEDADKINAEMTVRASLKDPDSAKFGEFTNTHAVRLGKSTTIYACLTVNSKNSFGGYVGNQEAIVFRDSPSGKWYLSNITKSSHVSCVNKMQSDCIEAAKDGEYKMSCILYSNGNPNQ